MDPNYTSLAVAGAGAALTVLGAVATALINSRMKDSTDAATMREAISNAIGAMQQALVAQRPAGSAGPQALSVERPIQAGVQYALAHAGDEFERAGIGKEAIAAKLNAKLGLIALDAAAAAPANLGPAAALPTVTPAMTGTAPTAATPQFPVLTTSLTGANPP